MVEFVGVDWFSLNLLVDEGVGGELVGDELLGLEPQSDLFLGVLQSVTAVDDVPERRRGQLLKETQFSNLFFHPVPIT